MAAAAGFNQKKDSPDCPSSQEVFSYNERVPAAAGLGVNKTASFVQKKANESDDCPSSQEVFSYNERRGTAAGFVQLSACSASGIAGVSCIDN